MSSPDDGRFDGLPRRALGDGRVVVQATSHRSRRRGLARLDALAPEQALHIPQCPSVHTFGMRFALDLIWLRRDGRVVRIDRDVAPWRMRLCVRARSVIETRAGEADAFIAAGLGAAPPPAAPPLGAAPPPAAPPPAAPPPPGS